MKQSNMTVLFHSWLSKLCVTRLYNRCLSEIINIWVTLEILGTLTIESLFKVKPTIFFISTLERVTALCAHLDELIGFHSTFSVFVW